MNAREKMLDSKNVKQEVCRSVSKTNCFKDILNILDKPLLRSSFFTNSEDNKVTC